MRAATFERTGPARDVLRVRELPDPEPLEGEVIVRVSRSGINPTDVKIRAPGSRIEGPGGNGLLWPFQIPHQDGAGRIVAVGPGGDAASVGQRVWIFMAAEGRPMGTAAELARVPGDRVSQLPDTVSYEQAAGLGIPFLTAYGCLASTADLAGRTVLVTGGAGAVGNAAIQIASLSGATVLATVSTGEKAEIARQAGANTVINYREADVAQQLGDLAPNGVDRVVDVALSDNFPSYQQSLADRAVVASYARTGNSIVQLPYDPLAARNIDVHFRKVFGFGSELLGAAISELTDWLAAGRLLPLPSVCLSLDDIAEAHEIVEAGAMGKVMIALD